MTLQISCHLGLQTSEVQLGLKDQLPESLTWSSAGLKNLTCGTPHWLSVPTTWHLASPRMSDTKKKKKKSKMDASVLYNLISGVTPSLLLYSVGYTDQPWYNVQGVNKGCE